MTEKRLHRSTRDKMIFGVCGGFAEYLGIDSSLVRIIWVIVTLFGGSGVIAYIVAAIILPEQDDKKEEKIIEVESERKREPKKLYRSRDERMIWGVCGGIAEYFNIDVSLVRIGFVLFATSGGFGILLYIIMAIVMPSK